MNMVLLGTMSSQAASAVAITGGTITGITDLAVADGGTGSSTAAAARAALAAMGSAVGSGTTTRATTDSTGTQNIAHGLGIAPTLIHLHCIDDAGASTYSDGWSVGTTQHTCNRQNAGSVAASINCQVGAAGWTGTVSAVDATNFTISWVAVGAKLNVTLAWFAVG